MALMPPLIVVSGADKRFFIMSCLLMRSLTQCAPELPFYCFDYGLDEAQRRYFRERAVLIERPANVPANLHPIVAKTALGEYLRGREWSSVLWLDSDMLAVGPLQQSLSEALAGMDATQCEVAACSVERIAELLAGGWSMAPFVDALRSERVDFDSPYYNNGAVVFRSQDFLDEWWKLAQKTPPHLCIDQNLFTLLALRRRCIMPLSARTWNLHGAMLSEARSVTQDGQLRIVSGEESTAVETALILHPTSVRDAHHVSIACGVGRGPPQVLKVFRNATLRECQRRALSDLAAADAAALARAGADRPEALLEAVDARFPPHLATRDPGDPQTWRKVGRLEPCPCGSGKRYKHCHGQYV